MPPGFLASPNAASVETMKGLLGLAKATTGGAQMSLTNCLNACKASGGNSPFFQAEVFEVKADNGALFREKHLIRPRKKLKRPKYCATILWSLGGGKSRIALTLSLSGLMPSAEILNPRKAISLTPKWHFFTLSLSFSLLSMAKASLSSFKCS